MSTAVLLRDATRVSRRWQTYGLRTAFSGALMCLVLVAIWAMAEFASQVDVTTYPKVARGMFVAFSVIQVLLAGGIAPAAVARAVIEERDQHTLDLLVLTRLRPSQILLAKIAGRLMVLLTLILGALPVLALVTSLGGIAPVEVVAVTAHGVITVVLLGALGGFFGIFTRSPIVAAVAAVLYGALVFLGMPVLYLALTLDVAGVAYVSPLFGTAATNWAALLPVATFAPIVVLVVWLGSRFYELRASGARLRRYFDGATWGGTRAGVLAALLGLGLFTVLPVGVGLSWTAQLGASGAPGLPLSLLAAGGGALVWAWCVGALALVTWGYLRIGMDFVMMVDDLIGLGGLREQQRTGTVRVWSNPVAWRELRGQAWSVVSPMLGAWGLVLFYAFQSAVWVIPGGLLAIAGLNALAAIVLGAWLVTATIERERVAGSLEILLGTTLPAHRVVFGKLAGAAAPSAAMLAVSLPLALIGAPYLDFVIRSGFQGGLSAVTLGALGFGWAVAVWGAVLVGGLAVALRIRNPRAAFGVVVGTLFPALIVPPIVAGALAGYPLLTLPARLIVPVLVTHPRAWEMLLSMSLWLSGTFVLLVLVVVRLREWGLRHA